MSDDFMSLNNEANTLKSTIDKLYTIKEEVSPKCDNLKKEIETIAQTLSSSEKWKECKDQDSVKKKIHEELPDSLKKLQLEGKIQDGEMLVFSRSNYRPNYRCGILFLTEAVYRNLYDRACGGRG